MNYYIRYGNFVKPKWLKRLDEKGIAAIYCNFGSCYCPSFE